MIFDVFLFVWGPSCVRVRYEDPRFAVEVGLEGVHRAAKKSTKSSPLIVCFLSAVVACGARDHQLLCLLSVDSRRRVLGDCGLET